MRNKKILALKRYSNRKLYCPDRKKFFNFDEIKDYILKGYDIRVIDHVSDRDITLEVLAKIFAQETMERSLKTGMRSKIYTLLLNLFILFFKKGKKMIRRGKARIKLMKMKKGKPKKGGKEYGCLQEM